MNTKKIGNKIKQKEHKEIEHNQKQIKDEQVQMKVFRMNKYDFVAAPSKESAVEWYKSIGEKVDDTILCEIDPETHAMWYSSGESRLTKVKTTFAEVLKIMEKTEPYLIDRIN